MTDVTSERRLRRRSQFESSGETPLAPDAPSAALSPADVSPPAASPLAGGDCAWLPIDDHARSGLPFAVRSATGETAQAYLAKSRRFDYRSHRWEPTRIWRVRNASGTILSFDPVEYCEIYSDN